RMTFEKCDGQKTKIGGGELFRPALKNGIIFCLILINHRGPFRKFGIVDVE
ncbi:MAG: hypothetical protein RLZZ47_839, partial [Bacteroidota bacterium]